MRVTVLLTFSLGSMNRMALGVGVMVLAVETNGLFIAIALLDYGMK